MISFVLLALVCVFPRGSAENPGVVAPLVPVGESVAFWWDDTAFHVGEKAYPWKDLKVEPKDGATFKLPLGTHDREPIVLEATLDSRAHRLRVGSAGPVGGSDFALDVKVQGSFDDALRCRFMASGQAPDYVDTTRQGSVKAGQETAFSFSGHGTASGKTLIEITGGSAPTAGKTAAADDMGTSGLKSSLNRTLYKSACAIRSPGMVFDYQFAWTDREKLQLHVVSLNWSDSIGGGCAMRLSAKDLKTMTMGTWTKTQPLKRLYGVKEDVAFDVGDLPEGFYWMLVDYLDAAGKTVHSDRFRYFKPGAKMPWEGTQLGNEDTVPPPWTAPTFAADGTFGCWNRTIRFGGEGLVTSIVNGGTEMLTEPLAILLDGKPLAFDVALKERKNASATYLLTARDAPVTVEATCEFDGYVRFALSYGAGVKSLAWRVSLDRSQLIAFDDGRGNDTQEMLTNGRTLDRAFNIDNCRFWWTGGVCGLCGGFCSLRGLHLRKMETAGHVRADAKALTLTTKLVDEPYAGERRTATFYIEPTPMKPKNMEIATWPADKLVGWTGHLCEHFETKYPGFAVEAKFKTFADKMKSGSRVFFYNATHAFSPDDPFYAWFGTDWIKSGSAGDYAHEVPIFDYPKTRNGRWTYGCTNAKSYFDAKLWGVNWYLNEPVPEMKDLYFDVCNPAPCYNTNAFHPCGFTDDFGRRRADADFETTREFHKRVYRLVKAKNADGALYGHLTRSLKPTDAFFDYCILGEFLAWRIHWQDNYYDIFTPELMQAFFLPRSVSMLVTVPDQFARWRSCWSPDLLKTFNQEEPKLQHAIRHFVAYTLIHDMHPSTTTRPGGLVIQKLTALGRQQKGWHYYDGGEKPVTLSAPGPRQLWTLYRGNGKTLLVVLNDTDQTVKQTVTVKGLAAKGKEFVLRDKPAYDFSSGSCTMDLGPRACRFVWFE